jgi:uncharacterized DUF497 family protein
VNYEQEFQWDGSNIGHLARHDVSRVEAEEAIVDPNAILLEIQSESEERVKAVGATTSGRVLVVIFTWRGDAIRAITAYDAPVRAQKLYLEGEQI